MRAVNMAHYKFKLRDLSRELYIEHGWKMPLGLVNSEERNPLNFTLEEWQQAKRAKRDPAGIKAAFQDCWAISDSKQGFIHAMEARGYYLAQGDRRGFVALDYLGEVYSLSRWAELNSKQILQRLGEPDLLPSVDELRAKLREKVESKVASFTHQLQGEFEEARVGLQEQKRKLVTWQRDERAMLRDLQAARAAAEARTRFDRFRSGLKGLWDRLIGRHAAISRLNEQEYLAACRRDEGERQALIDRQLAERRSLHQQIEVHRKGLQLAVASISTASPASKREQGAETISHRNQRRRQSYRPA